LIKFIYFLYLYIFEVVIMAKRIKHAFHGCCHAGGHGHAFYGLGFIGAAVYYVGQATTFWAVVLGFLKAIVWPAFLVFGLLKSLGV
jgi:hypothetical protein